MEVLPTDRISTPKTFSLPELWFELQVLCPHAPKRSQFYAWLVLAWIVEPEKKGGKKEQKTFTQEDLNRLLKFYELRIELKTLRAAQAALLIEIKNNPTFYGG
jgi:hypothetical protein